MPAALDGLFFERCAVQPCPWGARKNVPPDHRRPPNGQTRVLAGILIGFVKGPDRFAGFGGYARPVELVKPIVPQTVLHLKNWSAKSG
jgi:hypothetical protein